MRNVRIVIDKKTRTLVVYDGTKPVFSTPVSHGKASTSPGRRFIKGWVWGPVASRPDYLPSTWFSFGATFDSKYCWPEPSKTGLVNPGHRQFEARRIDANYALVKYGEVWYEVWKDSNPFGILMADLEPGKIELHGTGRDRHGRDVLPSMSGPDISHGCIRVSNDAIQQIHKLASVGTEVMVVE